MADERVVDEHLGLVLEGVLDALYKAKQVAWAASGLPAQTQLRELVAYLIDQSGELMRAEERIDGRAPGIASPSSHQRGNIVAEAHGDTVAAIGLLVQRIDALAADVGARVATISDAQDAPMLIELADGLEARSASLRAV